MSDGLTGFAALCDGHARQSGNTKAYQRRVSKMAARLSQLNGGDDTHAHRYLAKAHAIVKAGLFEQEWERLALQQAPDTPAGREGAPEGETAILDALGAFYGTEDGKNG